MRAGPRPGWEAWQQRQSPQEGWVSTGAVGGEGAAGCWDRQGPGVSGPAGLQEGAGCGERCWAAAGHGRCRGGCQRWLGGAGRSHGGSGVCRWPLLATGNRTEPLTQGARRWGPGLPLLLLLLQGRGPRAPATAPDTLPIAVVGQQPPPVGGWLTGPMGLKGCWVMAPLVTASWKEGSRR